jgi:hypothetical protein
MESSILDTSTASLDDALVPIGSIVRLQVQTAPLKHGEKPHRWYEPAAIRRVPELLLDDGGATGFDGEPIADVHHRGNAHAKFRGDNGLSIGFTGHYARIRERFGEFLADGIAGENILVDAGRVFSEDDLAGGLVIVGGGRQVAIGQVVVAPPCVEFSRFCAGYGPDRQSDRVITETLQFLHEGMRGFYATLAGASPARIAVGDMVYMRRG